MSKPIVPVHSHGRVCNELTRRMQPPLWYGGRLSPAEASIFAGDYNIWLPHGTSAIWSRP